MPQNANPGKLQTTAWINVTRGSHGQKQYARLRTVGDKTLFYFGRIEPFGLAEAIVDALPRMPLSVLRSLLMADKSWRWD